MKIIKYMAVLGLAAALTACAGTKQTEMASEQDIVDVAVSAGSFNTLVAAGQQAGLVDTLTSNGPFTVCNF